MAKNEGKKNKEENKNCSWAQCASGTAIDGFTVFSSGLF
jgi:hypothetical protein